MPNALPREPGYTIALTLHSLPCARCGAAVDPGRVRLMVSATGPLCDTCVQALGLVSALEAAEAAHQLRNVGLRGDGALAAQAAIAVVRHSAILWALVRLSEALNANGAARTGVGGE